ncbi:MAG: hypothetical protein R3F59_25110 [Myxococcota bacterium]
MMTLLVGLLLVIAPAHAVDRVFQFGHEVYLDRTDSPGVVNGDDYFKTNGVYKARWALVYLIRDSDGALLESEYTDDDGLVHFQIPHNVAVRFRLFAHHDVNGSGRHVVVKEDATDLVHLFADGPVFYDWSLPGLPTTTTNVVFDGSVTGNEWINVAAIASWTVRRRASAFPTGVYYKFALDDPGGGLAGKWDFSEETVLIDPGVSIDGWRYKTVIAHELGHALQYWANGAHQPITDVSLNDASCPSAGTTHRVVSKEYQSGAINEGMAQWVAAVAFNNTTEADCKHVIHDNITWHVNSGLSPYPYSCEGYVVGGPDQDAGVEDSFGVSGADYMHEPHGTPPNDVACTDTTPNVNTAVELDWERFLWDLVTKEGVTFGKIVEAYDEAEPQDWYMGAPRDDFANALEYVMTNGTQWLDPYDNPWHNQAPRNGVDQ